MDLTDFVSNGTNRLYRNNPVIKTFLFHCAKICDDANKKSFKHQFSRQTFWETVQSQKFFEERIGSSMRICNSVCLNVFEESVKDVYCQFRFTAMPFHSQLLPLLNAFSRQYTDSIFLFFVVSPNKRKGKS